MRTEPQDHLTPCWLRLTYRDGHEERVYYQRRTWALNVLAVLPLRARDGVAPWPDVARAKIIPALTGGSN